MPEMDVPTDFPSRSISKNSALADQVSPKNGTGNSDIYDPDSIDEVISLAIEEDSAT